MQRGIKGAFLEVEDGLGNEIVVWIDDEKCSDLFIKLQILRVLSSYEFTYTESQIC